MKTILGRSAADVSALLENPRNASRNMVGLIMVDGRLCFLCWTPDRGTGSRPSLNFLHSRRVESWFKFVTFPRTSCSSRPVCDRPPTPTALYSSAQGSVPYEDGTLGGDPEKGWIKPGTGFTVDRWVLTSEVAGASPPRNTRNIVAPASGCAAVGWPAYPGLRSAAERNPGLLNGTPLEFS